MERRWGLNWGEKWIKEGSTNLRSCISSQKQTIENNGKCANNRSGYFFWSDFTSLFFQFFSLTAFWEDVKTNFWTSGFLFIAIFQLTPVILSDCGAHWPNLHHPLLTNLHCFFFSCWTKIIHFWPICTVFCFLLDQNNPLLTNLHCFFLALDQNNWSY